MSRSKVRGILCIGVLRRWVSHESNTERTRSLEGAKPGTESLVSPENFPVRRHGPAHIRYPMGVYYRVVITGTPGSPVVFLTGSERQGRRRGVFVEGRPPPVFCLRSSVGDPVRAREGVGFGDVRPPTTPCTRGPTSGRGCSGNGPTGLGRRPDGDRSPPGHTDPCRSSRTFFWCLDLVSCPGPRSLSCGRRPFVFGALPKRLSGTRGEPTSLRLDHTCNLCRAVGGNRWPV